MKPFPLKRYFGFIFPLILIGIISSGLAKSDYSPRQLLNNARFAATALLRKYTFYYNYLTGKEKHVTYRDLWYKVEYKKSGVTKYNQEKTYNGLTLFTNYEAKAFLIDMNGNILHEWHKPFQDVWPDAKHILDRGPDKMVYWRKAMLFPNGDVIAVYEGVNQTPYGGGIIKVDKDSNLLWKVAINAHHDFDIHKNGNIYALMHEYTYINELKRPIISDGIAIISPEGQLLNTVPLFPIIFNSKTKHRIFWDMEDPFHANNLEFLKPEQAKHFPMFSEGDILISLAQPSLVMVWDGETYEPKWELFEIAKYQHDPDFLDDGTILVFDNYGAYDLGGGRSQILSINPEDNSFKWQYTGTVDYPFHSVIRGSQQKLPNGNVLITESTKGRIFEVSPYGNIVWEYISESLERGNIGIVCSAERYGIEDLSFLNLLSEDTEDAIR